jgi:SecD/SecF fusion protein
MKQNNTFKWLLVLFVLGWAIYSMIPLTPKNLIEAFEESAANPDPNFKAITTKARELEKTQPGRTFGNLREAIGTNDVQKYFPAFKVAQERDPARAILNRVQRNAAGKIKLGLDLQGGTEFVVEMQTEKNSGDTNAAPQASDLASMRDQAIEVLRKRVDRFGVSEPIIQPEGQNRIRIQLPGLSEAETETAVETIRKAAYLEFRLVHPESEQLIAQGLGAPGYEKLQLKRVDKETGKEIYRSVLVKKGATKGLTGKYVTRAGVTRDPLSNEPKIFLRFDSKGAEIFGDVTKENVGQRLAIVLDGEVYSDPAIHEPITGGEASISGSFDVKEAYGLANVLMNPLDVPLNIVESHTVDPSLGADSIKSGIRASIIGVIAVALFMLVYYMQAGLIANAALILNIVITIGVLCALGTTLTLPGIAGLVLTVGMAVDANVLIYERIREELAAGKSMRGALFAGYDKAFATIFDSHVTTLIASIILMAMGTGSVKGFGVTLTFGVAASLFTAYVVTKLIFDALMARNLIKTLPMLHMIKSAHLDFLKLAKPAFATSWAIILIGIGYGIYRGHDIAGVDFAGGDSITFTYDQKVDGQQLRKELAAADPKLGDSVIQYQTTPGSSQKRLQITVPFETGPKVEQVLTSKFPQAKFQRLGVDKVGAIVGAEILRSAIIASLLAMFGILLYVAVRYEFSFAVGAVVAIIHDVLMTMGVFFLSGRQLNAPIVAAILTIIGFSINDTIVIFDRIREDLKLGIRGSFKEIMNKALNQTLSRTIITSGTVFLATLSLYIFGGGAINDFAFTFLVGIVTGTYSSIYIASALVLWWHHGQRPAIGASPAMMDNTVTARA